MKWGRVLFPILALVSPYVCFAQDNRSGPDLTQRAISQAMRDGRLTDAEKLVTDAIHELEKSDPQNPRLATYLKDLAGMMKRAGRREEAQALVERAYEIDRNAFGPNDLRITGDLIGQALEAQSEGNNGEAERLLNQAVEIVRSNAAKIKPNQNAGPAAGVVGGLARLYIQEQRWIEAEPLVEQESRFCDLIEEPFRSGYADCGRISDLRAEIYRAEGKGVDVAQPPRGEGLPPQLDALNKIAEQFAKDGLYPSAEDAYNRAIALAEKMEADPQNHYGGLIFMEMNFLGQLFEKEGFKDRAERIYMNALEMNEKQAGPEPGHTAYARMLSPYYLVNLYRSEGRMKDAEPLLQRVLDTQVRSLGERNRTVLQTIMMFAGVYEEEGKDDPAKLALARPLYERALAIQEVNLRPDDRDLIAFLKKYADFLMRLHDDAKAAEVRARIATVSVAGQDNTK